MLRYKHQHFIGSRYARSQQHAENKHGKQWGECFPGVEAASSQLNAARATPAAASPQGSTKKEKKKAAVGGLDDLLSAGLVAAPGKKKGRGKK